MLIILSRFSFEVGAAWEGCGVARWASGIENWTPLG